MLDIVREQHFDHYYNNLTCLAGRTLTSWFRVVDFCDSILLFCFVLFSSSLFIICSFPCIKMVTRYFGNEKDPLPAIRISLADLL